MTKNFIKQKRFEMGLRMKNFNIMGGFTEKSDF